MILRKKARAYRKDRLRDFVLLWIEEDTSIKDVPVIQPYYLEPTKKELANYLKQND